jgi:hypothetical protein
MTVLHLAGNPPWRPACKPDSDPMKSRGDTTFDLSRVTCEACLQRSTDATTTSEPDFYTEYVENCKRRGVTPRPRVLKCPDCHGRGRDVATHVRYADGSGRFNVDMQCSRCKGTGMVPDEMAEWIRVGAEMREQRVNGGHYRTLHDEAKRRGMTAAELSKMENGRIKPIPEGTDAQRATTHGPDNPVVPPGEAKKEGD